MSRLRIGILGYGNLGQYLAKRINADDDYQLAFLQNRTIDKIPQDVYADVQIYGGDIFNKIEDVGEADIVIEASHPDIIRQHGVAMLAHASLFITSLTCLSDSELSQSLAAAAIRHNRAIYIPTGAGWGFQDIRKMASVGMLQKASIDMTFHADALKLNMPLRSELESYLSSADTADKLLYEGDIRSLAAMAPNNVNTMCGLALAAGARGFDDVRARLYARKSHHDHEVRIRVDGEHGFYVDTHRVNPAVPGAVTGNMTFSSFWSSLMLCSNDQIGIQFV